MKNKIPIIIQEKLFYFIFLKVRLFQLKIDNSLCIRLESELDFPAEDVYRVLSDHSKSIYWDMLIT